IVVPSVAEQNVTATPKDAIIAEVSDTSQQYKTWLSTDSGGATYQGKTYYRRQGPFTSLKDAQAAYKTGATTASSPIPGVGITPGGGLTPANPIPGLAQVGDFFAALTQANTWIRVAKVLGGGLLLVIGIAHITGAGNAVATAARKVPVPI
ncbi:MAG TPA: hypothetical protein VFX70_08130, partial [Mycobacteriales bacterium]|nr:hypothetical protein [Mycobacteriales bacterium]